MYVCTRICILICILNMNVIVKFSRVYVIARFDPPFVILPGDELVTICEFNSLSSQRTVYQGDGTYDEMCFAFLTVYPADAFLKPYRREFV